MPEEYVGLQAAPFDQVECQTCFCLVRAARRVDHDAWHERLREEVRELGEAVSDGD